MRAIFAAIVLVLVAWHPAHAEPTRALDLVGAARAQIGVTLFYDPSYQQIAYPMGDVPMERGVCSDGVIRAFRAVGIDLQQELHRDMERHFAAYQRAGASPRRTGTSITGASRTSPPGSSDKVRAPGRPGAAAYQPGDVVAWVSAAGGRISASCRPASGEGARPLVIHNIGWGAREEDALFETALPGISAPFRPIFSPFPAGRNWLECGHSGLKAKPKDPTKMNTDAAALRGNWNYPTSVKFGCGRIKELADHCKALGMKPRC